MIATTNLFYAGQMTTAEKNLENLLNFIKPVLHEGEFVFATVSLAARQRLDLQVVGEFREAEGCTLILPVDQAKKAGLEGQFRSRLITLSVHSDLNAVGFLAVVSAALAARGISVNVVSAYYHDHLFVPVEKASQAMSVLQELAARR